MYVMCLYGFLDTWWGAMVHVWREVRGPQESPFTCMTQEEADIRLAALQASWYSCLQLLCHHSNNEIPEAGYGASFIWSLRIHIQVLTLTYTLIG